MSFAVGFMSGTSSCASENIELRKCEVLSTKAQTLVCYQKYEYEEVQAKNEVHLVEFIGISLIVGLLIGVITGAIK